MTHGRGAPMGMGNGVRSAPGDIFPEASGGGIPSDHQKHRIPIENSGRQRKNMGRPFVPTRRCHAVTEWEDSVENSVFQRTSKLSLEERIRLLGKSWEFVRSDLKSST